MLFGVNKKSEHTKPLSIDVVVSVLQKTGRDAVSLHYQLLYKIQTCPLHSISVQISNVVLMH